MPSLTVTLTAKDTNYNLYSLIIASTGFSQAKPTCRELTITSDPGNGAAKMYRLESNGDATNFGYELTAGQSQTYRSDKNNVPLGIYFRCDADGKKLNLEWNYQ